MLIGVRRAELEKVFLRTLAGLCHSTGASIEAAAPSSPVCSGDALSAAP